MAWIIWLAIFVVMVGIEAASMALTTIWFAGGAIVAFILAFLGLNQNVQMAAFFVVSLGLLFSTRPWALKYLNNKTIRTNVEGLIGKTARITADVDNDLATGAAVVGGQEWTARSHDGTIIKEGTMVKIESVKGVRLIVSRLKEE